MQISVRPREHRKSDTFISPACVVLRCGISVMVIRVSSNYEVASARE
jgi:hypothetical protein